ncbi:hypothetical protein G9A89_001783 [Geosiphon pyriformis]|nr:hypothetical protein G9A89_001783 [Geosiphon pyriformis]
MSLASICLTIFLASSLVIAYPTIEKRGSFNGNNNGNGNIGDFNGNYNGNNNFGDFNGNNNGNNVGFFDGQIRPYNYYEYQPFLEGGFVKRGYNGYSNG